jgi:hypothetical protein
LAVDLIALRKRRKNAFLRVGFTWSNISTSDDEVASPRAAEPTSQVALTSARRAEGIIFKNDCVAFMSIKIYS